VPVKYGRYRVEVLNPETRLVTRFRFYAGWSAKDDETQGVRPDRVALKLDKPAYADGDTAKADLNIDVNAAPILAGLSGSAEVGIVDDSHIYILPTAAGKVSVSYTAIVSFEGAGGSSDSQEVTGSISFTVNAG